MNYRARCAVLGCVLFLSYASAQAVQVHEDVMLEGEMQVLCVDNPDAGTTETIYAIVDPKTKKTHKLRFEGGAPDHITSGDRVKVHGKKVGEEVVVAANGETSIETVEVAAAVSGERRAVVLLINFLDKAVPCGRSTIQGIVSPDPDRGYANVNVSDYYYEASYQQVLMNFDVQADGYADIFGPFTIDVYSTDPCSDQTSVIYDWAARSDQAATAAGVPLGDYQHIVYVFPTGHSCGFVALGNIGCGTQCRTWMSGCGFTDAFAHELGHNLGLHHAASDINNDGVQEDEYGDFSCIMGYGGVGYRHPNAAHKDHLGWFNLFPGSSETVSAGGTYSLAPLGLDPALATLPQVLKIYIPSRGEFYYLSYRVKTGYEQSFWNATYPNKLNIHRARPTAGNKSYFVSALAVGQQFSDRSLGVTVTNVASNSDPTDGYVTIDIDYACVANAPSMSVSPTAQTTSGSAVNYGVTILNGDAGGCGPVTFEATGVVPTGWTSSVSPATVSVAPGASANVTWAVTPPAGVADAIYSLSLIVRDPSGVRPDVVRYVSCTIDSTPLDPPVLRAKVIKKDVVELSWSAAAVPVSAFRIYRDEGPGYVLFGITSGTSHYDTTLTAGMSANYYVKAVDISGNESGPSNIASASLGDEPGNGNGKKK